MIKVTSITRGREIDPLDRPKLFVTVRFQHDEGASRKLKAEGRSTTPAWNGWNILQCWNEFKQLLHRYGMSESDIENLKLKIESM